MSPPPATPQEMADNNLPMHARDSCANILIPLNKCRRQTFYWPGKCEDELHSYEICMFKEYERRRKIKTEAYFSIFTSGKT